MVTKIEMQNSETKVCAEKNFKLKVCLYNIKKHTKFT